LETYFVPGAEFRDGCGEKKEGDKRKRCRKWKEDDIMK